MTIGGKASSSGEPFRATQILRPRAQVEHQIREAILRGEFSQGDKLPPETELAQQFGVSRPTVREALGSLVAAGLIRKIPGVAGGSFVKSVTPDSLSSMLSESMDTIVRLGSLDIDELTSMRRVLEVPAASWAASNRQDQHVAALEGIVEPSEDDDDRRPRHRAVRPGLPRDDRPAPRGTGCSPRSSRRSTRRPSRPDSSP